MQVNYYDTCVYLYYSLGMIHSPPPSVNKDYPYLTFSPAFTFHVTFYLDSKMRTTVEPNDNTNKHTHVEFTNFGALGNLYTLIHLLVGSGYLALKLYTVVFLDASYVVGWEDLICDEFLWSIYSN